jgi:hypothetical protein
MAQPKILKDEARGLVQAPGFHGSKKFWAGLRTCGGSPLNSISKPFSGTPTPEKVIRVQASYRMMQSTCANAIAYVEEGSCYVCDRMKSKHKFV